MPVTLDQDFLRESAVRGLESLRDTKTMIHQYAIGGVKCN